MFVLRALSLLVSGSLLAGCAVGPDYHRPDLALSDRYQTSSAVSQSGTGQPASFSLWWQAFHDPLLSHLVSSALAQNLDIAQAAARLSQARAGVGAATAALLPSATVSAEGARARQSLETPIGQLLNATPDDSRYGSAWQTDLNASWELDLFGGLRRGREAALAEYQAAQAAVVATRLAVAAQTADSYITLRGLQARLEIARQQVAAQHELTEKVRLLTAQGLVETRQLQQSEGALAQVEARMPALQQAIDAAMNALDVMLATPPGTHRTLLAKPAAIPSVPQMTATGTPADLLRRRPDLIVAERRLAATNARIGQAIGEYYPTFSLSALLGSATAISEGHLFSGAASQASGVIGLRWRLFDFGRINAQIAQAKGEQAEALAAYRQAALRATADVENALSALTNNEKQTATLIAGETALSSARNATFSAWQQGAASLIDVLYDDQNLLQAADARAQAQTATARAAVATFNALGGGWQPEKGDVAPAGIDTRAAP